jgi:hypothetical protein
MLDIDEKSVEDAGFFAGYFPPLSSLRYGLARKRPRMRFVQRVFFRQDNAEVVLGGGQVRVTNDEGEERQISDEDIKTITDRRPHRFWPREVVEVSSNPKPSANNVNGDGKDTAETKATGEKRKAGDETGICGGCSGVGIDCDCDEDATPATKRVRVTGANED